MGKEVFTIAMREINKAGNSSALYLRDIHEPIGSVTRIAMVKGNPRLARAFISLPYNNTKQWSVIFDINDVIAFKAFMDTEEENEQEEDTY